MGQVVCGCSDPNESTLNKFDTFDKDNVAKSSPTSGLLQLERMPRSSTTDSAEKETHDGNRRKRTLPQSFDFSLKPATLESY